MAKNLYMLPPDLPVPEDDGACDHLTGSRLPSVALPSTGGSTVDLSAEKGWVVAYFYPMTGNPDQPPMLGWNKIPGARGCTTECCAFRDRHLELRRLGATVFGVSSQPFDEQKEAAQRLHLPFELLNDSNLALAGALKLPTFEHDFARLIKRVTLVLKDGVIRKVYYPVFPPHLNPTEVIAWLEKQA
ncbi:peroxiredoxin [Marinimicrobium sp. ABcell2]|uniref:peroxiredoxin n=1 Tax=Marinimicrobium sp. ABcell2 TaxID=3069751 RepID=UPI0027B7E855|nr:peroxiredoxin [Marinimicrobium sp. ABcell2]MDQ2076246.1 peroxiredoxin [Marinimicrobium sp. ABcell2]